MSRAIPTISTGCPNERLLRCVPIGPRPAQYRRAIVSLITATSGADPQRECEDGGGGDAGPADEEAQAIPNVLMELFEPGARPDVSHLFRVLVGIAELEPCLALRLARGHALAPQVFGPCLQVERQLVREIAVELAALEETREPEPGSRQHGVTLHPDGP
jgi:hypothetical protein